MSAFSRRLALREFLIQCRSRLQPGDVGLGTTGRRRVAGLRREEVAGLAGISPLWYTMLETGRYRRVSPQMLHRLSTALRLSDPEAAYLFSLAIDELPALPVTALHADAYNVLGAYQSMRSVSRRLWASSTYDETLEVARECAMNEVHGDVVATRTRGAGGRWQYSAIGDDDDLGSKVLAELSARWGAAILDVMHCLDGMTRPGAFMTRAEQDRRFPDLAAKRSAALDAVGWHQSSWAMTSIQSKHGFVSRLVLFHSAMHDYSPIERAKLTAIADLTSFALST